MLKKFRIRQRTKSKIIASLSVILTLVFLSVLAFELNHLENLDYQIINELQNNLNLISNAQSRFRLTQKQFEKYTQSNNYVSIEELIGNGQEAENFLQVLQKGAQYSIQLLPLEEYLIPIRDDLNFFLYKINFFIEESSNTHYAVDLLAQSRSSFLAKFNQAQKVMHTWPLNLAHFNYQRLLLDNYIKQEHIYHNTGWMIYNYRTHQFHPEDNDLKSLALLQEDLKKLEQREINLEIADTLAQYHQNASNVYSRYINQKQTVEEIQEASLDIQKKFAQTQDKMIDIFLGPTPVPPQGPIHFCFFAAGVLLALALYWFKIRKKWINTL